MFLPDAPRFKITLFSLLFVAFAAVGLQPHAWRSEQEPASTELLQVASAPAAVRSVGPLALTVSNVERSLNFYTTVLGFEVVEDIESTGSEYARLHGLSDVRVRTITLRLGDERLQLVAWRHPTGRLSPADSRSNDLWFQHVAIIVSDMDRAYEILRSRGVTHISPSPQRIPDWNEAAAGIRAFYFRDPDGHPLEILWFPSDKGQTKWHEPGDRLFLGIDHTAIAVSDTEASLRFYRDLLGMQVAGASLNYGPEQEQLSGVAGARVRITALRAPAGPGVEFLEYLNPRGGRPAPADQRPNDLVSWQTVVVTHDARALAARLAEAGVSFVSPDVITLPMGSGFKRGLIVRDPDGHFVRVIETGDHGAD